MTLDVAQELKKKDPRRQAMLEEDWTVVSFSGRMLATRSLSCLWA